MARHEEDSTKRIGRAKDSSNGIERCDVGRGTSGVLKDIRRPVQAFWRKAGKILAIGIGYPWQCGDHHRVPTCVDENEQL
jgi:hypothetical protein